MEHNNSGRCSLTMNGEKLDLLFGLPACERVWADVANKKIILDEQGNITSGISATACLIFAGYHNACLFNDKPVRYNVGDFISFMEDNLENETLSTELTYAGMMFQNSQKVINFLKKVSDTVDDQKKRMGLSAGTSTQ